MTDTKRPARSRTAWLRALRARVRALPGGWVAWRIGVTLLGVAVVAVGVVLLPLPGPGWLIIFGGLGILASEYPWAARLLRWARAQLLRWTRWLAVQPLWVQVVASVLSLVLIVALVLAGWWFVRG